MNDYQQASSILATLATLYNQLATLYAAQPLDQAAIDQVRQEIETLEQEYQRVRQ